MHTVATIITTMITSMKTIKKTAPIAMEAATGRLWFGFVIIGGDVLETSNDEDTLVVKTVDETGGIMI